jgi:hypothetical protein
MNSIKNITLIYGFEWCMIVSKPNLVKTQGGCATISGDDKENENR